MPTALKEAIVSARTITVAEGAYPYHDRKAGAKVSAVQLETDHLQHCLCLRSGACVNAEWLSCSSTAVHLVECLLQHVDRKKSFNAAAAAARAAAAAAAARRLLLLMLQQQQKLPERREDAHTPQEEKAHRHLGQCLLGHSTWIKEENTEVYRHLQQQQQQQQWQRCADRYMLSLLAETSSFLSPGSSKRSFASIKSRSLSRTPQRRFS
ncbi:hypothetical protein Emed_007403 [Eimeria media]